MQYLNGKRSGKGKEYDNDCELIFEGEYINGKGKEFYKDELIFEVEYINGKKHVYDNDWELSFEGEYLNGEKMEEEKNIILMVI